MRIFTPNRWGTLALAVWFGGLYCFLGCEMGVQAAVTPAASHSDMRPVQSEPPVHGGQDACRDFCKKPAERESGGHRHNGKDMQCCRAMSSIAIEKSKLPKIAFVLIHEVSGEVTLHAPAQSFTPQVFLADLSGAYLRHRTLRI